MYTAVKIEIFNFLAPDDRVEVVVKPGTTTVDEILSKLSVHGVLFREERSLRKNAVVVPVDEVESLLCFSLRNFSCKVLIAVINLRS